MTRQYPLFENMNSDLLHLPNPKILYGDRTGVHSWVNFYAAFSQRFVDAALHAFSPSPDHVVMDPFVGSGTTIVGALKTGSKIVGFDIDPFSCLLSRAKAAVNADTRRVRAILKPTTRSNPSPNFLEQAREVFDHESLSYASTVLNRIQKRLERDSGDDAFACLLSDNIGLYDSEAVALAALCIGASDSANLVKGSNPTWYRIAVEGELVARVNLESRCQKLASKMLLDLRELSVNVSNRDVTIFNAQVDPYYANQVADLVITSPPYLTRIDYVIKNLPSILILSGLISVDIEDLRSKMMGTAKMVMKQDPKPEWGSYCIDTIERITNHPSYASKSYYTWFYRQYFADLYDSLNRMTQACRPSSMGLLVVQNSFYKELEIQLDQVLFEMLDQLGLTARSVKTEIARKTMKRLNPKSKQVTSRRPEEHVILFHSN